MGRSILITGGLGFLGSAMVRHLIQRGHEPVVVDLNTYAGDERRLDEVRGSYELRRRDVADPALTEDFLTLRPDVVLHFAAETHVTRSESDPDLFVRTNVEGTRQVLDAAAASGVGLVVHVSTDEVYGPCYGKPFHENDKQRGEGLASSIYARSKAMADDLAIDMSRNVPTIVVRPTNCFGPWQHPEKAIPRWITRGLRNQPIPVWGDGQQQRQWMFVEDLCDAIQVVSDRGRPGTAYNIGPEGSPPTNLGLACQLAGMMGVEDDVYLTQYDRPDHDKRYAIDASKVRALGWKPLSPLQQRLEQTVAWYRDNENWWSDHIVLAESLYDDQGERKIDR